MFNEESSSIQFAESSQSSVPIPKPKSDKVYCFLMMGAATIVILAGIKAASAIVSPMLLALFMAIILVVPLRWLRNHGCPNSIALIIVLGGTVFVFSGISYFVGRSLNDFILRLPAYKNRIVQKLDQLDRQLEQYGFVLGELGKNKESQNIPNPPENSPENSPTEVLSDNDLPISKIPVAQIPAIQIPVAQIPTVKVPATKIPTGEIPAAEIPAAETPVAETPSGEQKELQPEKTAPTLPNKSATPPDENGENIDSHNSSTESSTEKTAEQESI
ncbi:MAG: AI-2E family transporter, partial [Planctomycetaceae bacterium]|nr:AI-2E family transporter [Planctomycetaceae bacterium]